MNTIGIEVSNLSSLKVTKWFVINQNDKSHLSKYNNYP